MTRCENARLGVGTTTRYDRTARSKTNHRYRSCWHQRHMARPTVSTPEGCQQGGPETGSSSEAIEYTGKFWTILECRFAPHFLVLIAMQLVYSNHCPCFTCDR